MAPPEQPWQPQPLSARQPCSNSNAAAVNPSSTGRAMPDLCLHSSCLLGCRFAGGVGQQPRYVSALSGGHRMLSSKKPPARRRAWLFLSI